MENISGGDNTTTVSFFNNSSMYQYPEGFNPETDKIVFDGITATWYHYYTVNEILEKLIPVFGLIFIGIVYLSYTYIAPATISYLKSKYGRNLNEN